MAERRRGAGDRLGGAASNTFTVLSTLALLRSVSNPFVQLGFVAGAITLDFIKLWNANKRIPQCQLFEGIPEAGDVVYKQLVVRESQQPCTFRYRHPTGTITAIACVPVSADIQSPGAEVIEGGIDYNFVTICLTPVKQGRWACEITICGKPSEAKPSTAKPSAAKPSEVKPSTAKPSEAKPSAAKPSEAKPGAAKPSAAIQSTAKPAIETGRADAAASERSSRTIPQCRLVDGTADERDVLHDKTVFLQSREPYDYEYSKPGYTFTGISCLPVSAEIQSPDAEVISGGINCSSVTIRLKPLQEGHSSCRVVVCGRLSSTGPSADVPK